MTFLEKDGLRLLDSINEVKFGYDVQTPLVLFDIFHELWNDYIIKLSFPILSFNFIILHNYITYFINFGLFKSSMLSLPA